MRLSVFDIFKIGIGPSSSHTVGPMKAARRFAEALEHQGSFARVARVTVELYGSLGHTGKGHGTDVAVLLGLEGELPDQTDVDAVPARLERIVASMGEASSLEAMLADSELESLDLVALVASCIEGYHTAYAGVRLRLDAAIGSAPCDVAPEAIAQALDKLVGNAVDFATPGSEIVVRVDAVRGTRCWRIAVTNEGPPLPAAMAHSLFESMVSVRGEATGTADPRGHLGLGLYLVRLIAEFHGGSAEARNVAGGVEVSFTVRKDLEASSTPKGVT